MADSDCTMKGCFERGLRATFQRLETEGDFTTIEARLAKAAGRAPNGTIEREEIDQLVRLSKTTTKADGSLNWLHARVVDGVMQELGGKGATAITARQWLNRKR